ncbi:DUF5103 domain-containing protein [Flavobacterium sp. RSSA_27]|uniref:type IX secretion system plug protein n=1 Tax=Flavobacterium sp. RSSA_27 TaxID=3447667 RepID=UPI003F2CD52D
MRYCFLKIFIGLLSFLYCKTIEAQALQETIPPYNIKTVSFMDNGQNVIPVFKLGESFELNFDDLFGNEANYYYEIVHCDYNWVPSDIPKQEYLKGLDNQRIIDYSNSFNCLQLYSHYQLSIPNQFTQLALSGNYVVKILNEDRDVVFSRKFIIYEDLASVRLQIKRGRNLSTIESKQNLDFSITSKSLTFQNPLQNVKVLLLQNRQFNTGIKNITPQYTIGNELIYKYDSETQFWAGNEFRFFDNKEIRNASNNVAKISSNGGIYNSYLFTDEARANFPYSFTLDANGNFVVRNLNATNQKIEADYAWVYFSLSAPSFRLDKDIYITGMFNNFALTPENKMEYNEKKNLYEKALLIKQGFTNYQYVIADAKGKLDPENSIDGNFYQTENEYEVIVYYRENTQRYDRVIGFVALNSVSITN